MANTWSSQTWGFNQWNDLANVSYTLTGQDLSLSLGDETTAGEINSGWGRHYFGVIMLGVFKVHYRQLVILYLQI
jgi:hypothetical protein